MNSSNGNFLDENGNPVNIVQLLKTGKAVPVENPGPGLHMAAHSGWFTDENGTPVNIVALIDAAIDEDGGEDEPAIGGISVNGGNVVTPDENGIINLTISGDGSTVIDSELSKSSTNPVQNKVVAGEIEDLNEAVDSLNGSLDTLNNSLQNSVVQVNSDVDYNSRRAINASGQFINVTYPIALSDYIPVNYGKFYILQIDSVLNTRHTLRYLRIHAYDADKQWIKQLTEKRFAISKETMLFDVVPDEEPIKYLRISIPVIPSTANNEDRITKVTFFEVNQLFTSGISDYLRYDLHTVPPSEGAFNAIKRARQLTDAKWTPVANLPRTMLNTGDSYLESHGASYQGQFSAGKQYEGMPYSYTHGTPRYIGINEPIDSFYSCLTNENSVLYTNSVYSANYAVYYGITCSTVVGYALDLPNIDSNYYAGIKGMEKRYNLVTNGVRHDINDMKIGDVLFHATHVAMVGDIIKDGINVTDIEILEGTRQGCTDKTVLNSELGGVARRFWMTTDEFFTWFDGFALYRYNYIDSVKFVRNPYVPLVYGEKSMPTRYFPCMPFYGNRKVFTSNENGDVVRVLIHDTNYTHLIVYKDGVQYGVYEVTGLSYVDVNCEYGEAEYSANLITYDSENQINAKSIACYWYMMPEYDFTVTDDKSYHNISVTMRKGNFVPWYVTFKSSANENNPVGFTIVKSSYEASTSGDMTTYTFSVVKGSSDSNVCILALQSIKYAYFKLQKTY